MADTDVLYDFYREGEASEAEIKADYDATQAKVEALEFKRMLSDEEDQLPAIIDINPGAGGTESQDWAEILARMYRMYGEKQAWKVTVLDWVDGDGAGGPDQALCCGYAARGQRVGHGGSEP